MFNIWVSPGQLKSLEATCTVYLYTCKVYSKHFYIFTPVHLYICTMYTCTMHTYISVQCTGVQGTPVQSVFLCDVQTPYCCRDVVEDLKAFKAGRFRPKDNSPMTSPSDSKPNNMSPSYDGSQVGRKVGFLVWS